MSRRNNNLMSRAQMASGVKELKAICVLAPEADSGVKGVVEFSQVPGQPTRYKATLSGLSDGNHGFHIHEFGNLMQGCTTAGGHFNPFGKAHGGPNDVDRHVGDLGNIASAKGRALLEGKDSLIQLSGPTSIIGRAVVVHRDEDDLGRGTFPDSKTTGHAGPRLACGVIGTAN